MTNDIFMVQLRLCVCVLYMWNVECNELRLIWGQRTFLSRGLTLGLRVGTQIKF